MNRRRHLAALILAVATGVLPCARLAAIDHAWASRRDAAWRDVRCPDPDGAPAKAWSGRGRGADFGPFLNADAADLPPGISQPAPELAFGLVGWAMPPARNAPLFLLHCRLLI